MYHKKDEVTVIGYIKSVCLPYEGWNGSDRVYKSGLHTILCDEIQSYRTQNLLEGGKDEKSLSIWYIMVRKKNSVDHMGKVTKSDDLYGKSLEHVHEVTPDLRMNKKLDKYFVEFFAVL